MMLPKKRSFKSRLVLSYFLVVLLSFGLVAFFLDKKLEENSLHDLKASLVNQAALINSQISFKSTEKENRDYLWQLVKDLSQRISGRLTIIDTKGKVLADSEKSRFETEEMENHAMRPEMKAALAGRTGESIRYSATLKIDMLYVALPVKDNSSVAGAIRLALPMESVKRNLLAIRQAVFLGFLFALGLAFVFGSMLASGIIKPINKIIHASHRFSDGDFSRKIFYSSEDEIGELAKNLNKMAEDIENKVKEVNIQSQQLRAVFNSMIEGVIVLDNKARVVSVNHTVEAIFGVTKKETEGKLFLEGIRNNDIADEIKKVLEDAASVSKELALTWPVQKIFQVNISPMIDKGAIGGCLVVIHDITEIRRLETMRRDFVANVSHELKTPLTSIKGFIETLLGGALEDKDNSRHFLEIIQEHADRLNDLINDLLELSHIESREIRLDKEKTVLFDLVETVISGFGSQLNKKGIKVENSISRELIVWADKDKLGQVITNLLMNAVKFNKDSGFIKIYSEIIQDNQIKIVVEDSGLGIPAKDIPRIFERFYRVDKARSRQLGGTGLGLSIVKHIIELHSGAVGVESTEGLGSKFWFTLPV